MRRHLITAQQNQKFHNTHTFKLYEICKKMPKNFEKYLEEAQSQHANYEPWQS